MSIPCIRPAFRSNKHHTPTVCLQLAWIPLVRASKIPNQRGIHELEILNLDTADHSNHSQKITSRKKCRPDEGIMKRKCMSSPSLLLEKRYCGDQISISSKANFGYENMDRLQN